MMPSDITGGAGVGSYIASLESVTEELSSIVMEVSLIVLKRALDLGLITGDPSHLASEIAVSAAETLTSSRADYIPSNPIEADARESLLEWYKLETASPNFSFARHRVIPLSKGLHAIISVEDYEYLSQFRWHAKWSSTNKTYYVVRNVPIHEGRKGRISEMHREVLRASKGILVDHKNHHPIDNRRENLRFANESQNSQNRRNRSDNTSGYKGVSWHQTKNKWGAYISVRNKIKHLGYFDKAEDAYKARTKAAEELHGEFACGG
jgi:AP2 domain